MDTEKYMNIINKNRKNGKKENKTKKYLINLSIRVMIVAVLFLGLSIAYKSNENLHDKIYNYIYKEDAPFTRIKKFYNKYLGGILPIKKEVDTDKVFNETLKYSDSSLYYDGVKLTVDDNYLVPSINEGMVVFIGIKENYGNTIIIEDLDGVYVWYGNIANTSLKLYDYVERGTLVGEASKDLYLVFNRDDKYLTYEEYTS